MVTPQIARLLLAPSRVLAEHVACADAELPGAPRWRRARALLGVALHFSTIAVLVGIYMRVQDLLPYPAGRP